MAHATWRIPDQNTTYSAPFARPYTVNASTLYVCLSLSLAQGLDTPVAYLLRVNDCPCETSEYRPNTRRDRLSQVRMEHHLGSWLIVPTDAACFVPRICTTRLDSDPVRLQ